MKSKPNILSAIFSKLLSVEEMANENLPSSANNVTDISGES